MRSTRRLFENKIRVLAAVRNVGVTLDESSAAVPVRYRFRRVGEMEVFLAIACEWQRDYVRVRVEKPSFHKLMWHNTDRYDFEASTAMDDLLKEFQARIGLRFSFESWREARIWLPRHDLAERHGLHPMDIEQGGWSYPGGYIHGGVDGPFSLPLCNDEFTNDVLDGLEDKLYEYLRHEDAV